MKVEFSSKDTILHNIIQEKDNLTNKLTELIETKKHLESKHDQYTSQLNLLF